MSGKSRQIKDLLVTLLSGLQYNGEPAFGSVLASGYQQLDATPVAQVLPGNMPINRDSAHQADKVPTFIVRVRVDAEDTIEGQATAFNYLYDLADIVVDAIHDADQDETFSAIGVYQMDAALGDWLEVPTNGGVQLLFDINVSVTYSRNLQ